MDITCAIYQEQYKIDNEHTYMFVWNKQKKTADKRQDSHCELKLHLYTGFVVRAFQVALQTGVVVAVHLILTVCNFNPITNDFWFNTFVFHSTFQFNHILGTRNVVLAVCNKRKRQQQFLNKFDKSAVLLMSDFFPDNCAFVLTFLFRAIPTARSKPGIDAHGVHVNTLQTVCTLPESFWTCPPST